MAIFSAVPPPPEQGQPTQASAPPSTQNQPHHQHTTSSASTVTLDIEAWTVSALEALSVSPDARGTGIPFSIPIDDRRNGPLSATTAARVPAGHPAAGMALPRRPPSARDSQRKREAALKGNEGSRARRRWENARLIGVPNVQPPLPSDFEVHPTYTVRDMPYQLAQYWEKGLKQRVEDEKAAAAKRRQKAQLARGQKSGVEVGQVPRQLRDTAKKTPAVKTWVRDLEEPVRKFLEEERRKKDDSGDDMADSEDEEIVFVGRNVGKGESTKRAHRDVKDRTVDSGVLFDELGDDANGAFKRFLIHSLGEYYGLSSLSTTIGQPPKRTVYVGVKEKVPIQLPRPMWELF